MRGVEVRKIEKKTDDRGYLIKVLMQQQLGEARREFGEIYITKAQHGMIKGNHYHDQATEWFCVLSGEGLLVLEDERAGRQEIILRGEEPTVVRVPKGIRHGIKNIGQEMLSLLAYADYPYDPADTIPADIKF
jgi:UDP-2-acetamido-2,6-beta-L-arabino-hexul-4-ose reductase